MAKKTVLITNIGAVWRRVLDVVYQVMPQLLVIFAQEKEGWSAKNEQYEKQVLDKFFNDPLVKEFEDRGMIVKEKIETCLRYEFVFKKLYEIVERYSSDSEEILIDTTGMTKEATTAALNVESCFPRVSVVYKRAMGSDIYIPEKFAKWASVKGVRDLTLLPAPRIDVGFLGDRNSIKRILLRALLKTQSKHGKVFTRKDFDQMIKDTHALELTTRSQKISVGTNLRSLADDGFIKISSISHRSKKIEITEFGLCLASALEK